MNVPALTLPSLTPCIPHLSHHSPCSSSTTSTTNHAQPQKQQLQHHQQQHSLPYPQQPLQQQPQFCSPLDLLSHVALSQYPLPSLNHHSGDTTPPPTHPPPSSSLYASPTTPHNPQPLPSIRLPQYHSNYLSHSQSQTQSHSNSATTTTPTPSPSSVLYHADYSPLSCDDATTSTSRLSPHLPPPISKAMHTLKSHRIHRTSRSQPSRFCHICSRTSKKVGLMPCANFETGMCRKVVCQKCFNDHNWDWEAAYNSPSSWRCTHCRKVCPKRAQCAIYRRTNERRREQQQQHRSHRAQAIAALRMHHASIPKHYR